MNQPPYKLAWHLPPLFVFGAVLNLASSHALGQELKNPEKERLDKLALEITKDQQKLMTLRPTYGECRQIAKDQTAALSLWVHANDFYQFCKTENRLPLRIKPQGASSSRMAAAKIQAFRSGLSEAYQRSEWFGVSYWEKDETELKDGYGFTGFTRVNGRWVFVPRMDRAFTNKDPDLYSITLSMLSHEQYDDLYDLCSVRIREQIPRSQAARFFKRIGITAIAKLDWQTSGFNQGFDNRIIHKGVTLDLKDGRSLDLNMLFVSEAGDFRLIWIGTLSRIGIRGPDFFGPTPEACRKLAQSTFEKLVQGFENDDFSELYKASAKVVRARFSTADLNKSFSGYQAVEKIKKYKNVTVKLVTFPRFERGLFDKDPLTLREHESKRSLGPMTFAVAIRQADSDEQVKLTLTYFYEDSQWKPSGYRLTPPSKLK